MLKHQTVPITRSLPVTPSIHCQNRERRAETDGELCLLAPGSVNSTDVFLDSIPPFTFSFINVSLTNPQDVSILEAEAKKINVTVSSVITEKMPVGQNCYIQHFRVQNRSEKTRMSKECNKLDWKEKWALSEIIKDTATPFFVRNIRFEVPLRFIIYTTKYPKNESYYRILCKTHVKSCLNDLDLINKIEKYLNEKGRKDFHDIIRTTINHFERDAATAVRLANRFLQSK
ncbi:hypothetical protein CRE_11297 [Caenorhabditis remanei]|uniref:Uncharacterized protein n=1 Tax=Caenorhabditis remanei TaxID=31234 RepID=E3N0E1_CAERE|nr:hypothetical protein CRE_11297 [Caenorhabditis remanei]